MTTFRTVTNADSGEHTFRTLEAADLSQLIEDARERYAQVRCDTRVPLQEVSLAGIDVLSVDGLQRLLDSATL